VAKSWLVKVLSRLLAKQTAAVVVPNTPRAAWHAVVSSAPRTLPIKPVDDV
jgi:hypothetical protein